MSLEEEHGSFIIIMPPTSPRAATCDSFDCAEFRRMSREEAQVQRACSSVKREGAEVKNFDDIQAKDEEEL